MKGIVYLGDGRAELTDELTVRDPGPNEVLVKLVAAGLCHTDVSVLDGTIPWAAPAVMGHEGAGVVEQVGADVTLVRPGDHVVVSTIANCGMCRMCNTGHPTRCRQSIGNRAEPFVYKGQPASNFAATSAFAEHTVIKELQAVKINHDVPLTSACLIACGVMTGAGSVWNAAAVQRGDTAAVWGLGGVGCSAVQGLAVAGAFPVIAVDTLAHKEPLARDFGATHFVLADGDVAAAIRAIVPFSDRRIPDRSVPAAWTGRSSAAEARTRCAPRSNRSNGAGRQWSSECRRKGRRSPWPSIRWCTSTVASWVCATARPGPGATSRSSSSCTGRGASSSTRWSHGPTRSSSGSRRCTTCTTATLPEVCCCSELGPTAADGDTDRLPCDTAAARPHSDGSVGDPPRVGRDAVPSAYERT